MVLDHSSVGRVSSGWEWVQEALHLVKEVNQHFTTREGGEEVMFVALYDGGAFVPKVVTVKENVVDCVELATVWAGGVVTSICSKAG